MKRIAKKGQVQMLQGFIYAIVGIGVILAMGLLLLTALQSAADDPTKYCTSTHTYNTSAGNCYLTANASQPTVAIARTASYTATGDIVTKLATAPTYIGLLIVMVFIVVILGFFAVRGSGGAY